MITKSIPKTKEDLVLIGQFIRYCAGNGRMPARKHVERMNSVIVDEMLAAEGNDSVKYEKMRNLLLKVNEMYCLGN